MLEICLILPGDTEETLCNFYKKCVERRIFKQSRVQHCKSGEIAKINKVKKTPSIIPQLHDRVKTSSSLQETTVGSGHIVAGVLVRIIESRIKGPPCLEQRRAGAGTVGPGRTAAPRRVFIAGRVPRHKGRHQFKFNGAARG